MVGTCNVPGIIIGQFAMDEYLGNLRIAVSVGNLWDDATAPANDLYVYDDKLQPLGSVRGIAPRERIYSVRYSGATGYMVTFRQASCRPCCVW
jgi:inhibitor of cysteine peptidase